MKRMVSLFLCITLLMGMCSFTGCNSTKKVSGLSGKEIAKLLLANERLDSGDLSVGLEDSLLAATSSITANESTTLKSAMNSMVNMDTTTSGNIVSWSNFSNECNTYDFFKSYFTAIENSANMFAELIDQIKKDCGITGYWVSGNGGDKVLLKVEANQETIFVKSDLGYKVCRRYTNENADNVYEMYSKQTEGSYEERMLYVAGKRYEFSSNFGGYEGLYIVAENTRGYWNMFQVSDIEKNRCNIMNFVSTGNMAFMFDNSMSPGMPETDEYALSFSTTDLTNDIIDISSSNICMNFGAFNGIARVETDASNVWSSEGSNALTSGMGSLVTTSGKRLEISTKGTEDTTFVSGISASFTKDFYGQGNHRTSGKLFVNVPGENCSEQMANFKAFLSQNGLSCKYNLDYITSKYAAAQEIAKNFKYVYKWNGYSIKDYTGIENAVKVERTTYKEFAAMYDAVKDLKTVVTTSFGEAFEGWTFSKINSAQCGNVTMTDNKITVENMSVAINDTAIFDTTEKYSVFLALAKFVDGSEADYDNAVIMECEGVDLTSFAGEASIKLNQSATFTLPRCASEGKYTVVAYVATEDGIRVSEMIPVIFSDDIEKSETYDGFIIDYKASANNQIRIDCSTSVDVYIKPEDVKTSYTYDEIYEVLKQGVLSTGYYIEGANIELYDASTDSGTELETGAEISAGTYRMKFIKQIGEQEVDGYVYFEFK